MFELLVADTEVSSQVSLQLGSSLPSAKRVQAFITDRNTLRSVYRLTQQVTFFEDNNSVFDVNVTWMNQFIASFEVPALAGQNRAGKIDLTMTELGIPYYQGQNLVRDVGFAASLDFGLAIRHLTLPSVSVISVADAEDIIVSVRYGQGKVGTGTLGFRDTIWERLTKA